MPDARVLSALLGIGFVMTHIFFNRGVDQSRPRTRGQAKIEADRERQSLNMSHVLDSWTCSRCRFENRCLRSARARRNNLECTNCRNDFICAVSPRKVAHKGLLDDRPVQVTRRRPARARRVGTRDASRRRCTNERARGIRASNRRLTDVCDTFLRSVARRTASATMCCRRISPFD